jgi:hypothetical protein
MRAEAGKIDISLSIGQGNGMAFWMPVLLSISSATLLSEGASPKNLYQILRNSPKD